MKRVAATVGALIVVVGGAFLVIASVPTGGKVAIGAGVAWWVIASAVIGKTLLKRDPDLRTPVRATLMVAAVAALATTYLVTRGNEVDEEIATATPSSAQASPAERDAALSGQKPAEPTTGPAEPEATKAKEAGAGKRKPAPTAPPAGEAQPEAMETAEPKPRPKPANVQLLAGTFTGESGHRGEGKAQVIKLASGKRVITFSRFDVDPGAGNLRVYLHEGKTTSDDLGEFIDLAKLKGTKGNQQYELPADLDLKRYDTAVIWCVPFSTRIAQAPLS